MNCAVRRLLQDIPAREHLDRARPLGSSLRRLLASRRLDCAPAQRLLASGRIGCAGGAASALARTRRPSRTAGSTWAPDSAERGKKSAPNGYHLAITSSAGAPASPGGASQPIEMQGLGWWPRAESNCRHPDLQARSRRLLIASGVARRFHRNTRSDPNSPGKRWSGRDRLIERSSHRTRGGRGRVAGRSPSARRESERLRASRTQFGNRVRHCSRQTRQMP